MGTDQIKQRRAEWSNLTKPGSGNYLLRTLYEECFSINQNTNQQPPPTHQESAGMTTGGLVSHYYLDGVDQASIEEISSYDFDRTSPQAAVASLTDTKQKELLMEMAVNASFSNLPFKQRATATKFSSLRSLPRVINSNQPWKPRPWTETSGFGLLNLLLSAPEFLAEVEDPKLLEIFDLRPDQKISRAHFLSLAWKRMSYNLIDSSGHFKLYDDGEIKEILAKLLRVRLHPEMQIFFKYFSPSGYINEASVKTD